MLAYKITNKTTGTRQHSLNMAAHHGKDCLLHGLFPIPDTNKIICLTLYSMF